METTKDLSRHRLLFVIAAQDVSEQIENAEYFLTQIQTYLNNAESGNR